MINRVLFVLLSLLLLAGCEIPTASDATESAGIVQALESKYAFRVRSGHDQKRAAVYGKPRRRYSEVFIYGDYSPREQEGICKAARAVRREIATKPIRLYFYPRELERSGLLRREVLE